jgi:hypothetical protein
MVEYGHGVAEGAGQVSGSSGGGGTSDWGGGIGHMVGDAVTTVTRLPTEQLLLLIVAVIVGFWILRRAL